GEPERATRLFRANREHRLARTGACDVAVDPGDGAGGAQPAQRERARPQWRQAGGAKPRAARRHLGSRGLRDSLEPMLLERGPPEMMVRTQPGGTLMGTPATRSTLRRLRHALALLALALTFAISPAVAQQWTPQQRAACEPDAIRLCNQYVPAVQRTSVGMSHSRRYVS